MRQHGLQGAQRQANKRWLTQADERAPRPAALVERRFSADGPDQLWVCDLTYLKTREGFIYLAFVKDVFSRREVVPVAVELRGGGPVVSELRRA